MERCPDMAFLEALARGEAEGARAAGVAGHLAVCPTCRQAYREVVDNERVLGVVRQALDAGGDGGGDGADRAPRPDPLDGEPEPEGAAVVAGRGIGRYELLREIGAGGSWTAAGSSSSAARSRAWPASAIPASRRSMTRGARATASTFSPWSWWRASR